MTSKLGKLGPNNTWEKFWFGLNDRFDLANLDDLSLTKVIVHYDVLEKK